MIVGCDVSSYQDTIDWDTLKNNVNFVIIKATEGNGFTDPQFSANQSGARNSGLPHGYYHFGRPDLGNTAQDEASYFLSVVGALEEGEVLALDFEVQYNDSVTWSKAFLDEIFTRTGIKPLFYSYQSMLTSNTWTPVVDEGYGLWVASPGDPTQSPSFETGAWTAAAMWQWGTQNIPGISTGVTDSDQFFGDVAQFKAYGYNPPPPIPPPDPCAEYKTQVADLTTKLTTLTDGFNALQTQFDNYKTSNPSSTVTIPIQPGVNSTTSVPTVSTSSTTVPITLDNSNNTSSSIQTEPPVNVPQNTTGFWSWLKSILTYKIF